MREILLILHILAAATWIGASVAQFVFAPKLVGMGGNVAAAWMESFQRLGRLLYPPAALLALATGVGLVLESSVYEFEHAFVVIGILMVIIGAVLGTRYYGPRADAAAAAFSSAGDGEGQTLFGQIARVATVETALLVVTVAAMVYRWGA